MVMQVGGPDKEDKYVNVRTAENSRISLLNNAAFTGAHADTSSFRDVRRHPCHVSAVHKGLLAWPENGPGQPSN